MSASSTPSTPSTAPTASSTAPIAPSAAPVTPATTTPLTPPSTAPLAHRCNSSAICAICIDTLTGAIGPDGQPLDLVFTRCGHLFHRSCLNRSLVKSGDCPNCRAPVHNQFLSKADVSRVFLTEGAAVEGEEPAPVPRCVVDAVKDELNVEKLKAAELSRKLSVARQKNQHLIGEIEAMDNEYEGFERERDHFYRVQNKLEDKLAKLHEEHNKLKQDLADRDASYAAMKRELERRDQIDLKRQAEIKALYNDLLELQGMMHGRRIKRTPTETDEIAIAEPNNTESDTDNARPAILDSARGKKRSITIASSNDTPQVERVEGPVRPVKRMRVSLEASRVTGSSSSVPIAANAAGGPRNQPATIVVSSMMFRTPSFTPPNTTLTTPTITPNDTPTLPSVPFTFTISPAFKAACGTSPTGQRSG